MILNPLAISVTTMGWLLDVLVPRPHPLPGIPMPDPRPAPALYSADPALYAADPAPPVRVAVHA